MASQGILLFRPDKSSWLLSSPEFPEKVNRFFYKFFGQIF
nr:MAG TPA: hypothetical protein [Caudoviricetes sp.]